MSELTPAERGIDAVPASPFQEAQVALNDMRFVQPTTVVQTSGLQSSHVTGAGVGAFVGATVAGVLNRYRITISPADAALIGSFALSAGVGLGHVVAQYGVFPALKKLFVGKP
jgi:hypothetical protein